MAESGFGPTSFSDTGQASTQRNSLLRRVGLFVKKPYLDWTHTQTHLNPDQEDALRSQFLSKRERHLSGRESERDLHELRNRIGRSRAKVDRIAGGAPIKTFNADALTDEYGDPVQATDSLHSRPRAMQSTLQHTQANTVPMSFEGSLFTLSAHVAPGDGMEVRTLDQGGLQSLLDEASFSYAMGDEISAEALLLHACDDYKDSRADIYPFLLDLYRVTQQTQPYAAAASLYSQAARVPMGMLDIINTPQPIKPPVASQRVLRLEDVQSMEKAYEQQRQDDMPCELRFDGVTQVEGNALKPLGTLLHRIASTPKEFSFAGLTQLINALQAQSAQLLASQDMDLHRARYCAARLAGNIKLFEDAARDFSAVADVPAPAWRSPACLLLIPTAQPRQVSNHGGVGYLYFALSGSMSKQRLDKELLIQNAFIAHSTNIAIDCSTLHSLSFDAAASLVDWVRAASSVGVVTKLTGLHRFCKRLLMFVGADEVWLELSHAYA